MTAAATLDIAGKARKSAWFKLRDQVQKLQKQIDISSAAFSCDVLLVVLFFSLVIDMLELNKSRVFV
jgi:hypothetical protein